MQPGNALARGRSLGHACDLFIQSKRGGVVDLGLGLGVGQHIGIDQRAGVEDDICIPDTPDRFEGEKFGITGPGADESDGGRGIGSRIGIGHRIGCE